jgi:hypothetical protein
MTGMEMMLKSFGLDPTKIKTELTQMVDETVKTIKKEQDLIKETLTRVEGKLDLLLAKNDIQIDTGFELPEGVTESGNIDGPGNNA